MYGNGLIRQFEAMGARARVLVAGLRFEIDVIRDRHGKLFDLKVPHDGSVVVGVDDVDRRDRQLLLAVQSCTHDWSQKFLCGHDEYDWFVAALPQKPEVATVGEAFEALKPPVVLREQQSKGMARRKRRRRKTEAYVRQGEWFFVPRPNLVVEPQRIRHNDVLVRNGGTPHVVEWLYGPRDQNALFALGCVSHPDHKTVQLEQWYQVFRNTEVETVDQPIANRMRPAARPWNVNYVD